MSFEENLKKYSALPNHEKMEARLRNAAEVVAFLNTNVVSPGSEVDVLLSKGLTLEQKSAVRTSIPNEEIEEVNSEATNLRKRVAGSSMNVSVRDNNVDEALRYLKKKLQREGAFREMRLAQHSEKPANKVARKRAEEIRRRRKLARKKGQRKGLM
jgi:small subunit ribosomal protein S21